ncbi:Cytidine deaminase-like protein [Pleurotus pulmonarius]|nr:hypothetical protein EYR36_003169 [Pleurotus pulmonarius]
MFILTLLLSLLVISVSGCDDHAVNSSIPLSTRIHWMRRANAALAELSSPCPFAAFGTAIVNHTAGGLGELVCIGVNSGSLHGDPTLHGEIAAIQNCSKVLTDPAGPYNLTTSAALSAFRQLSLYTNAESCPMCASAVRWAGFREYIYGTSIADLIDKGWGQISITSKEIFRQSSSLSSNTSFIPSILTNETDPLFAWQFDVNATCPTGCSRANSTSSCALSA